MEQESLAIDSFVLRFYTGLEENSDPTVRGVVTHVQTGAHIQFTIWADAVEFINRFVDLDEATMRTRR